MPYVKHKAIHVTPKYSIEYVIDGDKTAERIYVSGININTDAKNAYDEFKYIYEGYSKNQFYIKDKNPNRKENIRLHHYIQSFDPKENITPEKAHEIGMRWAKEVFGEDRQVLFSTHIDKGHIHNHFLVAPFSFDGVKWNGNKDTLDFVRKASDNICVKNKISIIENPKKQGSVKYKEWMEQKQGTGWKDSLRVKIDKLIINEHINSKDELLKELENEGYYVRRGKYITIRPPNVDKGIRTYRLGEGYSEQDIEYRLQHKDKEYSLTAIFEKFKGIQVEYALCLRQIQIIVYQKKENPHRHSVRDVQQVANILTYMEKHNIYNREQFANNIDCLKNEQDNIKTELSDIKNEITKIDNIISDYSVYKTLEVKLKNLENDDNVFTDNEIKEFNRTMYSDRHKNDIQNFKEQLILLRQKEKSLSQKAEKVESELMESENAFKCYERHITNDYYDIYKRIENELAEIEKERQQAVDILHQLERTEEYTEVQTENYELR